MPLYEYRCTACNHAFEVYHDVGGTPGPCPVCGGPVRRIFTSVGLIFKGSGFHTTDYRKSPASDAKDLSGDSGSKENGSKASGTKESAKTESGPGTEAASKGT